MHSLYSIVSGWLLDIITILPEVLSTHFTEFLVLKTVGTEPLAKFLMLEAVVQRIRHVLITYAKSFKGPARAGQLSWFWTDGPYVRPARFITAILAYIAHGAHQYQLGNLYTWVQYNGSIRHVGDFQGQTSPIKRMNPRSCFYCYERVPPTMIL